MEKTKNRQNDGWKNVKKKQGNRKKIPKIFERFLIFKFPRKNINFGISRFVHDWNLNKT